MLRFFFSHFWVLFACFCFCFYCSIIHGIFTLNLPALHSYFILYASQAPVSLSNGLRCSISEGRAIGTEAWVLPAAFPIDIPITLCRLCAPTANLQLHGHAGERQQPSPHPYLEHMDFKSGLMNRNFAPCFIPLTDGVGGNNIHRMKFHLDFPFPAGPSWGVHCPWNLGSVKHTQKKKRARQVCGAKSS